MICKEGYRQNEKRIIGISQEAFCAAILAGEIAFHHAEELHELAHDVDGEAQQLLHDAVVDFTLGNEKLEEALRILKGE